MYIVYLANVFDSSKQLLAVTYTEEKAKEYIDEQMSDGEPTGVVYYGVEQLKLI